MKPILLQVILIALNAIFAAMEIAVLSMNEKRIEKQAEEGKCDSRTADNEKHYPRFNSFLTHNAETDREKDDAEKSEPDKADEGTEAGQLDFRFGAEKKTSELYQYLFGISQ